VAAAPATAFTLVVGAAVGIIMQRGHFCLSCFLSHWFGRRDPRGVLALLAALGVGSAGYLVVFGAWIPDPTAGYLPPNAFVVPVGLHLVGGGLLFGLGMALSGSCVAGHLFGLGEGSLTAIPALIGTTLGFVAGFVVWNPLGIGAVTWMPTVWLPARLGYVGSAAAYLLLLGGVALVVLRLARRAAATGPRPEPDRTILASLNDLLTRSWGRVASGAALGVVAFIAYLRVRPLGVTSELGRLSRLAAGAAGILPSRLEGLDTLGGCATADTGEVIGQNGFFVLALLAGSLVSALASGRFGWRIPRPSEALRAGAGGVLLGFGAMISLGCSIGAFLSGTMAFSVSGLLFGLCMVTGFWLGLRFVPDRHRAAGCPREPAP
jgi:hypothetical protein